MFSLRQQITGNNFSRVRSLSNNLCTPCIIRNAHDFTKFVWQVDCIKNSMRMKVRCCEEAADKY